MITNKLFPLFSILLITACKPHVCPPTTKVVTHYDTIVKPRIDTLVIIQTYDSVPEPPIDTSMLYFPVQGGGWEMQPLELFKDGKRTDTIKRHTIIYY